MRQPTHDPRAGPAKVLAWRAVSDLTWRQDIPRALMKATSRG